MYVILDIERGTIPFLICTFQASLISDCQPYPLRLFGARTSKPRNGCIDKTYRLQKHACSFRTPPTTCKCRSALAKIHAAVSIILHVYVNDLLLLRSGICFVVPPPPKIWVCRYSSQEGVADRICTCRTWPFGAPALGTVFASEAGLKLPWNQRSGTADVRRFIGHLEKRG